MNELSKLLQENLNIEFISATLSNPKNKDCLLYTSDAADD